MSDAASQSPDERAAVESGAHPPPPALLRTTQPLPTIATAQPLAPHATGMSGLAVASFTFALLGALPLVLGALQDALLSHGIVLVTAEDFGVSFDPGPAMQVFFVALVMLLGFPLLAAIFGNVAQARIRRARGQLRGKRYANAALVIAYIQLAIELPVVLLFVVFYLSALRGGL